MLPAPSAGVRKENAVIGIVEEDGAPAGRSSRTTYLSELLAPVEGLVEVPPQPDPEARLTALSWAFALVAVAAVIVGGLIVYDVARSPASPGGGPSPVSCAVTAPCVGAR